MTDDDTTPAPTTDSSDWQRQARLTLEVTFIPGTRRVTARDVGRAADVAAAAFRAALESGGSPYKIESIEGRIEYIYVGLSESLNA